MQDRFKFRAWDGQDQEYDYNAQNISFYDHDEDSITLFRHIERDKPNVILEQCTGLKDKNGKLIYEGDILAKSKDAKPWDCYKVFWQGSTTCGIELQFQAVCYDAGFSYVSPLGELLQEDHAVEIEYLVVGNIHENPELLEG